MDKLNLLQVLLMIQVFKFSNNGYNNINYSATTTGGDMGKINHNLPYEPKLYTSDDVYKNNTEYYKSGKQEEFTNNFNKEHE